MQGAKLSTKKHNKDIFQSSESLQNHSKKVILEILIGLFAMTRYDFGLNMEMPYINPFRYMSALRLEVLVLNM